MTVPDSEYLRFAMFNGSVIATDALHVSPLGSGFMFGEGLFETVRVQNSRPILFDAHHARLAGSLNSFGAPPPSSHDELLDRCHKVIAANVLVNGGLKIIVFRDTTGWSEMILAREGTYAAERYETGFRLMTVACDLCVGQIHALKSLNYLPNIQAKRMALAAGFDEAVFFDPHLYVLEGATSNIFIVKDRVVSTPPLQSGVLPGVVRACVLQKLGPLAVCERNVALDELLQADEVFVTNALLGIMPVAQVDATAYDLGSNTITCALMAAGLSK
jgi:branched-subunit amino acid aminotransferase/4-amino-4-deoxychorismate lyase